MESTVTIESDLGKLDLSVPGRSLAGIRKGTSLLSRRFRDILCTLAASLSFRLCAFHFNKGSGRLGTGDEITRRIVVDTVAREADRLKQAKREEAGRILGSYGVFGQDGVFIEGSVLPGELANKEPEWIMLDPVEIAGEIVPGSLYDIAAAPLPEVRSMDREKLAEAIGAPSLPYSSTAIYRKKRREGRTETPAADKKLVVESYIQWLNGMDGLDSRRKILSSWKLERDSGQVVYISIDAVLVSEQSGIHVRGGKPAMKTGKTYVKHWNIRIDADGSSYFVTSTEEEEAYRELLAVLIRNRLVTRHLVFLVDGERKICTSIEKYFAPWSRQVILDYHHLEEKIYTLMSRIIIPKRVDDPREEAEIYKNGERKGQPKPVKQTSLSTLYAKEACLIAWTGNVSLLAGYIRLIPDKDVKNEGARQELLEYIENKAEWITCYALRKRAGLRNSSNGVEQQNQILVSSRQKRKLMSWREEGSGSVAAVTAMYRNKEEERWFTDHKVTFDMDGFSDTPDPETTAA